MLIVKLTPKNKKMVLEFAAAALRHGKVVAYPTDTTYGLGADALSIAAVKKIYKIKSRQFSQPVHVLVPDTAAAKKIVRWNGTAEKLARKFLPGPLSIALPLKSKNSALKKLTAGSNYLGFRLPKNGFAVELAKKFGRPITATSANPSGRLAGGFNPYSAADIVSQFRRKKFQPDVIIDAGRLPRTKPSTFVKIIGDIVEIVRPGPVPNSKIQSVL